MRKDLKKMIKALEDQGYEVRRTAGSHYEVRYDGRKVTTFPGTPSDHRSWLNALARAKRHGFRWPP